MTRLSLKALAISIFFSGAVYGSVRICWDNDKQVWLEDCEASIASESIRTIEVQAAQDFFCNDLANKCDQWLSRYSGVSKLDFRKYPFSNTDAERFGTSDKEYPTITALDISGHSQQLNDAAAIVSLLASFPKLENFAFRAHHHFECVDVLRRLYYRPLFHTLVVDPALQQNFPEKECNWHTFIQQGPSLRKLYVRERLRMGSYDWSVFCKALGKSKVTDLKLSVPLMGEHKIEKAAELLIQEGMSPLHTLTSLNLFYLPPSQVCAERLGHFMTETASLTSLKLHWQYSPADAYARVIVNALGNNKTITALDLSGNSLTKTAFEGLTQALRKRRRAHPLNEFYLAGNEGETLSILLDAVKEGHCFQAVSISVESSILRKLSNIAQASITGGINKLHIVGCLDLGEYSNIGDEAYRKRLRQGLQTLPISAIEIRLSELYTPVFLRCNRMALLMQVLAQLYAEKSYYHPRFEFKGVFENECAAFEKASGQPATSPARDRFMQIVALLAKL